MHTVCRTHMDQPVLRLHLAPVLRLQLHSLDRLTCSPPIVATRSRAACCILSAACCTSACVMGSRCTCLGDARLAIVRRALLALLHPLERVRQLHAQPVLQIPLHVSCCGRLHDALEDWTPLGLCRTLHVAFSVPHQSAPASRGSTRPSPPMRSEGRAASCRQAATYNRQHATCDR